MSAAGDQTVVARPAATVMLVRDATGGPAGQLEVLMVRRNLTSDFVGGAYVFPGGAVDPADGGAEAEARCAGRSDAEASTLLGLPSGGLAYWVAVLRECFEEAGVLVAYRGLAGEGPTAHGPALTLADPADERRFAGHRQAVNDGRRRFLDVCADEDLVLGVDQVHYFSHWITPEGAPRRYDTRFFVAAAPAGQRPVHDEGETIAAGWLGPAEALRRHREGEIELIFPTVRSLQAIGRFATSAELLAAAAEASGRVEAIEPKVVADGTGVRIVLPGDPDYDGGLASPAGLSGPGDFTEAVRAISRQANVAPGAQSPEPRSPSPPNPTG